VTESTIVTLRLKPETKTEWKQAVEESNAHATLTGLIRVAVADYIDDADDLQDQPQQNQVDKEDIQEIKSQIRDIDLQIAKIRAEQPDLESIDEVVLDRIEWMVEESRPEPDRY